MVSQTGTLAIGLQATLSGKGCVTKSEGAV